MECYRHQTPFFGFIGLPHLLIETLILLVFFTDTKHFLSGFSCVVSVGKPLTVESSMQGLGHLGGNLAAVDGLAVDPCNGGHILRSLHPSLQLQGHNAHAFQLLQIGNQTVVPQA